MQVVLSFIESGKPPCNVVDATTATDVIYHIFEPKTFSIGFMKRENLIVVRRCRNHRLLDSSPRDSHSSFAKGVCEHVRLGPKISETVKGKLSSGARIVQGGGLQKVFRQIFSVEQGEKLLKVCQCYFSTTSGPIAGLLFISTEKVAFCSERSLAFSTPDGGLIRTTYKVTIPLEKIKRATQSENVNKPSQKYIEIFTVDEFDF